MAKEEFTGFANAPVDEETGERLDFRDVDRYVDESDEGKARVASQTTPSSITAFKTDDKSTEGSPAAVVPAPTVEDDFDYDADQDHPDYVDGQDADGESSDPSEPDPGASTAEGPTEDGFQSTPQGDDVVPQSLEDAADAAEAEADAKSDGSPRES